MATITCDCELYEVCPNCAPTPEYYDGAAKALAAAIPKIEPRYSLTDIRELAREYADEHEGVARLSLQIMGKEFADWVERKEKEQDVR